MKQLVGSVRKKWVGGFLLAGFVIGTWYAFENTLTNQSNDNLQNDTKLSLSNLTPGSVWVEQGPGGLWSLVSNEASLETILKKTAEAMKFNLKIGSLRKERISVRLDRETTNKVLQSLLQGYSYRSEFVYDKNSEQHNISSLEVGFSNQSSIAISDSVQMKAIRLSKIEPTKNGDFATNAPPDLQGPTMKIETDQLMSEHITKEILAKANTEQAFEGSSEQLVENIANVVPSGDNLNKLVNSLKTDPDPAVRSAAAKQLALGGGRQATSALLEALKDEDKTVVMDVLGSLVQTGDSSIIAKIELAAQSHPDADVRNSLVATAGKLRANPRMGADELANSN